VVLRQVWLSDIGIAAFVAGLVYWGIKEGSAMKVVAMYVGPYMVCNAWLVGYTWLQHTDVDVPHLDGDLWTWQKGAFMTIDRPYGRLFDFLHHKYVPPACSIPAHLQILTPVHPQPCTPEHPQTYISIHPQTYT
jgi:fatty acid desaturase